MADNFDVKLIVKYLANGRLNEELCLICLMPLNGLHESILTKICKLNNEFCIADVLETICQIKPTQNSKVCIDCFMVASKAYQFYSLAKRSDNILNYYVDQMTRSLDSAEITENIMCLPVSSIEVDTKEFDFNVEGIGLNEIESSEIKHKDANDDNIIVIVQDGVSLLFKMQPDGTLIPIDNLEKEYTSVLNTPVVDKEEKPIIRRKRREPMSYKYCSKCPVKYRFVSKLKEHMRHQHNVELYYCKVCNAIMEDEQEYENHLKTHTDVHQCSICNMVCKKRHTMITHLMLHEKNKNMVKKEGVNICEICGAALEDEKSLEEHYSSKHAKKYTCYYCGRHYKAKMAFESHIAKHEEYIKKKESKGKQPKARPTSHEESQNNKKRCMCQTCGRHFVDERALMWHQRLHTNERPYICEVCGRGFVCGARRSQHMACAHAPPARRCPLCPALFHLRSIVNSHVKKVHLTAHKRRNRTSKPQNVYWRTETVPIQELSIAVQNELLEMQTAQQDNSVNYDDINEYGAT